MVTIHANAYIDAEPQRVWDALTDHAGYARFPGVSSATLTRVGKLDENGVGARRRIRVGALVFVEDVLSYDAPHEMTYRVIRTNVPLRHELGTMRFIARGEGTEVDWTSRLEVPVPGLSMLGERIARVLLGDGINNALMTVKAELEST